MCRSARSKFGRIAETRVSGDAGGSLARHGVFDAAATVFQKPITLETLARTVRDVLG